MPESPPEDPQAPDLVVLALSTCPDEQTAKVIAETLVRERLAACANRIPGVRSTYFWEGRLQDESEILLIIKTTQSRLGELKVRLKALHPYEVPELAAISIVDGNEAYLAWVRQGVERNDGNDESKI